MPPSNRQATVANSLLAGVAVPRQKEMNVAGVDRLQLPLHDRAREAVSQAGIELLELLLLLDRFGSVAED